MQFERSSGVLLHPTSLPGRFGIGDLGQSAYLFVDFLEQAGQTLWQVMALGPTGFGDSPYQCFSAFAGNPYLISLDLLKDEGFLNEDNLADEPGFPADNVEYGPVIEYKMSKLKIAYNNYRQQATGEQRQAVTKFEEDHSFWLGDFAFFMALKEAHDGQPWLKWDPTIGLGRPKAIKEWRARLYDTIQAQIFYQYLFFHQWSALKEYANRKGIRIIGDIPIFVALDSADVWSTRHLYYLDDVGNPTFVAGVPPDYFSKTGQLWGNPLYRWKEMGKDGYRWWVERIRFSLELYDIIRLDHFRGFEAFWRIAAKEETAIRGKWIKGPGAKLFKVLKQSLGDVPIIAEDLGVITSEVRKLRDRFNFPGMKVLQFAFGSKATNTDLPHNYSTSNCVVYVGTHDNDTIVGWYKDSSTQSERDHVRLYLGIDGKDINWDLIRLAFMSIADMAVVSMQDLLGLGAECRMNFPGKPEGNWAWRVNESVFSDLLLQHRLKDLSHLYGRNITTEET